MQYRTDGKYIYRFLNCVALCRIAPSSVYVFYRHFNAIYSTFINVFAKVN